MPELTNGAGHDASAKGHEEHDAMAPADKALHMARQIEAFFAAYPREQAVGAIAGHMNQFWSRKMRADYLGAFSVDDARLSPLLAAAHGLIKRG